MKKFIEFFKKHDLICIIAVSAIFAVAYSLLSVVRHMHFQSGAFDLGIYDQGLWQYAHFQFPYNTIKEKIILGDHLSLILPLLSPLYWVWDDVRLLLVFQAVWVSFSTIGIYLYLQKRLFTKFQSFLLSLTYILFYGIQFGIFFDFHPILLTVGLLAWWLYFWESNKWKLFWTTLFLILLTQENAGVAVIGICFIWFFQKKNLRLVGLIGLIGFVATAASFYAIHFFSEGHLQYVPQFADTPMGFVGSFFDQAEKQQVWWYSYISYGFLPLLSPGSVIAVVGDLAQYFTTGKAFDHMWSPFLHHRAILAIFLITGLSDVLRVIRIKKRVLLTPLVIILFFWSVFVTYHYHFALTKLVHGDYWITTSWMKDNEDMLGHVPPNASVVAQQSLVPHLTHRNEIYLVYPRQDHLIRACVQSSCWWLDFDGTAQYLVVDTHDYEWLTMTLESIDNFRSAVENMEKAHVITLYYHKGQAKIYTINEDLLAKLK